MNEKQREKIDALVEKAKNTNDPIEREAVIQILSQLDPDAVRRVYQGVKGKDPFASAQVESFLESQKRKPWWKKIFS